VSLRLLLPICALVLLAATLPVRQSAPAPSAPADEVARAKLLLQHFSGSWDTESSFMGSPPSKGTEEVKLLSHGLVAIISSSSPMGPGQTFEGHGLMGYDPGQKTWRHVWADNTDPMISISEGSWSADGEVFTIVTEIDMGAGPTRMVMETTITGPDTHTFEMRAQDAAAGAQPMVRMSYERRGR
jgi:hypothetical protein